MQPQNVLVFPAGTEIAMEINRALRFCRNITLWGATDRVSNHTDCVFRNWSFVRSVSNPNWISDITEVVGRNKIDLVFPAHDDVVVALAENRSNLSAKVVTSPVNTCQIARSKRKTYDTLRDVVKVPKVYPSGSTPPAFPVFAKPDRGQGSFGAQIVLDDLELDAIRRQHGESYVVTEHLPGQEYTVDCFSDREGGLLFVGGRKRVRTRSGISMNTTAVEDSRFREIATNIQSRLEFHGAWFFQLKENAEGDFFLLEVAPRIAGAMSLYRCRGVNFPLLSIYEALRIPVRAEPASHSVELDRALINRYRINIRYDSVYVDLDDTLLIREEVNTELIRFLFQSLNQGKKLILLTRHRGNISDTLARFRLLQIFDAVVHVPDGQPKSAFICDRNSILIDDSFSERSEVSRSTGISVFDCSMLEMLINDAV